MEYSGSDFQQLASYRRCNERMLARWDGFSSRRDDRLRHGSEAEKVAEAILEDLFTEVLDWSKGDLLYQEGRADIVLSQNGMKYLLIEVKRPGALHPNSTSLRSAVQQALGYAEKQEVNRIAVSDGCFLVAADIFGNRNAPAHRAYVDLAADSPPPGLWWLSVHGIYRACCEPVVLPDEKTDSVVQSPSEGAHLLHPKYKLPASCFAYVGSVNDTRTWKLPYLTSDGRVDERRLPKAIQALLRNYRGARVSKIPEHAIPAVLEALARAAQREGRMPPQAVNPAPIYRDLSDALAQLSAKKLL